MDPYNSGPYVDTLRIKNSLSQNLGARDHANACTGVQILVKKQTAVLCFGSGGGVIFCHENAVHFKCSLSEVIDDEYITQDSLSLDKSKKEETVCYEDFCENSTSNTKEIPQETNDEFLLFYDNLNIAELRSLAAKFGPLLRKERFIFLDQYRRCWAGLIGHLLLVYSGERDTKPSFTIDLHGYEARPAPNYIQRDLKRRDMCFEIVCPGKKTFHANPGCDLTVNGTTGGRGIVHAADPLKTPRVTRFPTDILFEDAQTGGNEKIGLGISPEVSLALSRLEATWED
uniref:Uncharacterized protein n=1 Tax=Timema genevievae TaxID=629358 RepID=A0A7R9K187_TIMGE|nr:unnamed protein product [Timema genevievae]